MLFDSSIIADASSISPQDLTAAIISDPLVVPPDMMVIDAIAQMGRMNSSCVTGLSQDSKQSMSTIESCSSCVLVASGNRVIGILTERDVVRLSISQNSLEGLTIQQVMTSPVMTLKQSEMTDLFSVISILQQHHIRHLPVIDDTATLVGMITHESLRAISRPISLLRLRQVSEVMTPNVVYATPESSILDVAQQMIDHRVSSIVIIEPWVQSSNANIPADDSPVHDQIDTENPHLPLKTIVKLRPIGLFTERDLVQFQTLGLQPSEHQAQAMMSTPVFSIGPSASLWTAQHLMDRHLINRVVVTGTDGELLGIVTQTSVLQVLNSPELYKLAELLEAKVEALEAEKIALLERQSQELMQQVAARTQELEAKAKREQVLTDLSAQIRSSLSLATILSTTVEQIHIYLGCDRVNIWQFNDDGTATVVAESTDSLHSFLGQRIHLDELQQTSCHHGSSPSPSVKEAIPYPSVEMALERPESETLVANNSNETAMQLNVPALHRHQVSMWEREHLFHLQTPEKILVPLFCKEVLWGVLNVSESRHHRDWESQEVELLQALSIHLAIALQQATAHEALQRELKERRQAEARQKASEQRYKSLAAAVPVGIFRTDRSGYCTYVNKRYCEIIGLAIQNVKGDGWQQYLHPDDRHHVLDSWKQCLHKNVDAQLDYRFQRPDGTIVWVHGQTTAEKDTYGNIVGYVGTITDISDRKRLEIERQQAEENLHQLNQTLECKVQERTVALEKREARYRALVDVLPDLLIRIHEDGTYLDVVVGQSTTPFNPQQFKPGVNVYEVTPPEHAQTRMFYVQQALKTGTPQFYEYELNLDGQLIIEEARIMAINDEEALVIIRDISDRKQAEYALRESESRFRQLATSIHQMFYLVTLGCAEVLYVSPAYEALWGRSCESLYQQPRSFLEGIHVDDRQMMIEAMALQSKGQETRLEYRVVHPDGSIRWVSDRSFPVLNESGQVWRTCGLVEDITDQKQAAEDIRQFGLAVENAMVGIAQLDTEGRYIMTRDQYAHMLGYEPKEMIGLSWANTVPEEDHPLGLIALETMMEVGRTEQDLRAIRKDGSVFYKHILLVKTINQQGEHTGHYCFMRDISERKYAADQLADSEERYRSIFEQAAVGLANATPAGEFIDINPCLCEMLGYSREELLSKTVAEITHPDDQLKIGPTIQKLFEKTIPSFAQEKRYIRKDGKTFWSSTSVSLVTDAQGNAKHTLAVVRDITERKQAELQLQELIAGTAATTGEDFFPALVQHISRALDVSHAIVCEHVEDRLSSLAFWANGQLQPCVSIALQNTPCEHTFNAGAYYVEHDVQSHFPQDVHLSKMGVNSYLGVVLLNTKGQPIGTLCMLHKRKITNPERAAELLRVFAARAAAELERQRAIASLEDVNQKLEAKVLQRTAALQERETRYRALMEGAGDGILLLRRNGQILEANPKAEELLGYSCTELATMHYSQLHPPEEMEKILAGFESMENQPAEQATHSTQLLDIAFLQPDGTIIPVDISASLIIINGEPMIQEILRDIRERKRMEDEKAKARAAIEESEARFRYLADYAPVLIWLSDRNNCYTHVNKGWLTFTGNSLEEELGNGWTQGVHPEELQFCLDTYTSAFDARQPFEMEYRFRRWDSEYRWILNVGIPRHSANGEFLGYIGSCIDISDRKQAEAQLRQTNAELARATRLKDEFLANMSHELRTPLNAILGMTEGLTEQIFGSINSKQSQALTTIEQSGTHLLSLINDILDVAKIESGQVELDYSTIPVAYLCRSSLTFIKQQAQKKRIQLSTHLPPGLPDLVADERRLRQVLINLLNNAVKFTPEGGTVTLSVSQHFTLGSEIGSTLSTHPYGEHDKQESFAYLNAMPQWSACDPSEPLPQPYIHISITDTGIGIEADHLVRLFQPFVQIDSALNRQYTGTGLGLALVKRIVELHGGQVRVTSEVGVGSCFTVLLPCALSDEQRTMPSHAKGPQYASRPAPEEGRKVVHSRPRQTDTCTTASGGLVSPLILLAEDNAANVRTVSSYLSAKGYRLIVATNGQEAVSLAQSETPDVVLMDIQMPGMDGLSAIQQLRREQDPHTLPIIALTALTMEGDRDRCLATGANDYLSKPIRLKQLTALIQKYVQAPT